LTTAGTRTAPQVDAHVVAQLAAFPSWQLAPVVQPAPVAQPLPVVEQTFACPASSVQPVIAVLDCRMPILQPPVARTAARTRDP
jgi:hypothetical protein